MNDDNRSQSLQTRHRRRYQSGVRGLEDRIVLSASAWSITDAEDPPASDSFSVQSAGAVQGRIWNDADRDGLRSGGEFGVADAVVELFAATNGIIGDNDDVSLGIRLTDAAGDYQFSGVAAGTGFFVVIRTPAGYTLSPANVGSDDAVDSDVAPQTAVGSLFTLAAGQIQSIDAGLIDGRSGTDWTAQLGDGNGSDGATPPPSNTVVDADGNIYVTGHVFGQATFGTGEDRVIIDESDGYLASGRSYLAKYSADGTFLWVKKFAVYFAPDVAVDAAGNVVIAGGFSGTADFDPGQGVAEMTSSSPVFGVFDVFVEKLDQNGRYLWAESFGSTANGVSVAIDTSGDILVAGTFHVTADFDPGGGTTLLTTSNSDTGFLVTLNGAGDFVRASQWGGTSNTSASIYNLTAYSTGLAIVGNFYGTIDFDPGTNVVNRTSAGDSDGFLVRLDSTGGLVWADTFGGIKGDSAANVAVDAAGNFIVVGNFTGTADFDPGGSTANLSSAGDRDVFVAKYSSSGDYFWVRRVGGILSEGAAALVIDGHNQIVIGGAVSTSGAVDFNPGGGANRTGPGMFFWKLDSAGAFVDAAIYGTIFNYVSGLAIAPSGEVVATGVYSGTIDFDPTGGTAIASCAGGAQDVFVVKFNTDGSTAWANDIGGGGRAGIAGQAVDAAGNQYLVGYHQGTVDFDPGVGERSFLGTGFFAAKYSAAGALVWLKNFEGPVDGASNFIDGLQLDTSGNLIIVGRFNPIWDLDPGSGTAFASALNTVLKLSNDGDFVWSRSFPSTFGSLAFTHLATGPNGRIFLSGAFSATFDFDPGPGTTSLTAGGDYDGFYLQLDATGALVWVRRIGTGGSTREIVDDIYVDASGNLAVTGSYSSGTIDFDPGPGVAFGSGGGGFLLRLDNAGNFVSAVTPTYSGVVMIDAAGNSVVAESRVTSGNQYYILLAKTLADGGPIGSIMISNVTSASNVSLQPTSDGGFLLTSRFQGSVTFPTSGAPVTITATSGEPGFFAARYSASFQLVDVESSNLPAAFATLAGTDTLYVAGTHPSLLPKRATSGLVGRWTLGAAAPEIDVRGANISIASGDTSPTVDDRTDFGATAISTTTRHLFTVANLGLTSLHLTGSLRVSIGGPNAGDFVVAEMPKLAYVESGESLPLGIEFAPSASGVRTAVVSIISDDSDEPLYTFTIRGTGILPPATVIGVYAGGSAWNVAFRSYLVSTGFSDIDGYLKLTRGAGQTDTLPWRNVDQIRIHFDNMPALTAADVQIIGSLDGPAVPTIASFIVDAATQSVMITFQSPLPVNKYLIYIADSVANFDGEWTDNVSVASGDGTAGGDFAFHFNVLPGDFDKSQSVSFGEIGQQRLALGLTTGSAGYNYRQDYDGSGSITFGEVGQARLNLGTSIGSWTDPPPPRGPLQGSLGDESTGELSSFAFVATEGEPVTTSTSDFVSSDLAADVAPESLVPFDPAFGVGGAATVSAPLGSYEGAGDVARQADGKYVVRGWTKTGANSYASMLMRFNADGSLDSTFGSSGKVVFASDELLNEVRILNDGKLVVGGSKNQAAFVARVNADGSFDATFGVGGKASATAGGQTLLANTNPSIEIDSAGRIVLMGQLPASSFSPSIAVFRFTTTGTLDTTLNGTGYRTLALPFDSSTPYDVALQGDDKIVVVGASYDFVTPSPQFFVVRLNVDGSYDLTYNNSGITRFHVGGASFTSSLANRAQVLADGKLLVVGRTNTGALALTRRLANGLIDPTFNTGVINTAFNDAGAGALAVQADGKFLVTGYDGSNVVVLRFTADGVLDTSFAGDGDVRLDPSLGNDRYSSLIVQSDGKIAALGIASADGVSPNILLVRMNTDGGLDTSLDGDGIFMSQIRAMSLHASSSAVLTDGKILFGGYISDPADGATGKGRGVLWRLSPDGTFDSSFGTGGFLYVTTAGNYGDVSGIAPLAGGGYSYIDGVAKKIDGIAAPAVFHTLDAITVDSAGRVLVAGTELGGGGTFNKLAIVVRFIGGNLDSTFAGDGVAEVDFHSYVNHLVTSIHVRAEGKIVVGGIDNNNFNNDFAAARLNADGSTDTTFAGDGTTRIPLDNFEDEALAAVTQSDGRLVVAGYGNITGSPGSSLALVRFLENGSLDTSFGGDGIVTTPFGNDDAQIDRILQQSDGKLLAIGRAYPVATSDIVVARYLADGTLDSSFDGDGILQISLGTGSDFPVFAALVGDRLLVAGQTESGGALQGFATRLMTEWTFVPPKITGVYAGGTAWTADFQTYLTAQGLSDVAGYVELSRGAGQTDTLPWRNVDQLRIEFSDMPALAAGDVRIIGSADGPAIPAILNFVFDVATQAATITFQSPLPANRYLIDIAGSVASLDGEWTDNVSVASGDGSAGGDFAFRFNVLPGDFDKSQSVSFGEIGQQRLALGLTTGSAGYNYRQDYDGSGSITFGEVGQARLNLGTSIGSWADPPPPQGSLTSFGGAESFTGPEAAVDTTSVAAPTTDSEAASTPASETIASAPPTVAEETLALAWSSTIVVGPTAIASESEESSPSGQIRDVVVEPAFDVIYESADEPQSAVETEWTDAADTTLAGWTRLRRTDPGESDASQDDVFETV